MQKQKLKKKAATCRCLYRDEEVVRGIKLV